ncbi:hypothetical protein SAMN02745973_00374 [Garciella nitratireducens DSM 15102]|uniref:Uncharacterized protein n=2 Tax=Garciella TaxID=218204 RepID=A0A1T4K6R5_9FIRM|nr:hypothetical protein SAMN02745973_00374 [Garciella nitratireducens DSM 15102]
MMTAELNLQKTGDFAQVQSIDFVERFNGSITKLIEALGVTRKIPLQNGMTVKTYKATTTLQSGQVAEGDLIPLSKVITEPDQTYEVTFDKYRKAVSAEAIQRHGFDQAVSDTDARLLKEIQKGIRSKFFNFLANGTGTGTATDLQGALAQAWGKVQTLFEDDGVNTIAFVNPLDVADYLGKANVTTQTVFGMAFISGFTGVTIITNTNVPVGTVYATAPENIVLAYVELTGGELGRAFSFTLDESGYIGVTHSQEINNLTYETVAINGILLFAERLDGVIKITISDGAGV